MAWYLNVKASHGIGIRRKWGNVHLICFIAEQKRWLVFKNAKIVKGLISTFNINWVEQYRRTGISCSTGMAKPRRHFVHLYADLVKILDDLITTVLLVMLYDLSNWIDWLCPDKMENFWSLVKYIWFIFEWVPKYNLSCFKRAWDTIETIARDWKQSFEKELWTTNRMWGRVVLLLCL